MKLNLHKSLTKEDLEDFLELFKLAKRLNILEDWKDWEDWTNWKNAYELWLENWNKWSINDFIDSLEWKPWKPWEDGEDWLSAYKLWIKANNKWNVKQFLESLEWKPWKNWKDWKDWKDWIFDFRWDWTKLWIWDKYKQEFIYKDLIWKPWPRWYKGFGWWWMTMSQERIKYFWTADFTEKVLTLPTALLQFAWEIIIKDDEKVSTTENPLIIKTEWLELIDSLPEVKITAWNGWYRLMVKDWNYKII